MAVNKVQSVIQRKAEAGRAVVETAPMTVARALELSLAKAAQEGMALALHVAQIEERRLSLAELPEALEDRALLAVLEGPAEGLGLVAIAPALLAALIEAQTTGRLAPLPPPVRRATRTDAAMVAGFIDQVLAGFEAALAELPDVVWAARFRYASYLDDPRPLGLLLADTSYRVMQLELALGPGGERKGTLMLALPAQGRGPPPRRAAAEGADAAPAAGSQEAAARWKEGLERVVLQAPVTLDAVLHRLTLPLSAVLSFVPGSELPVPLAALEDLRLEGLGPRLLARGRLGQNRGFRAVRLVEEAVDRPAAAPAPAAAQAPPVASGAPPRPSAARRKPEPRPEPVPEPLAALSLPDPMTGLDPLAGFGPEPDADGQEAPALMPFKMSSAF